jgi:hypothetical protein
MPDRRLMFLAYLHNNTLKEDDEYLFKTNMIFSILWILITPVFIRTYDFFVYNPVYNFSQQNK